MNVIWRATALVVCVASFYVSFVAADVPANPGDWPQWRGPNRKNLSSETGLLREWPAEGPKVLWKVDTVGVGYSSLAVKDGLVVTQGDVDGVEHILCLRADDGSTVWAVQPEPVATALVAKLADEMQRLDKNADGAIAEDEALAGIGPDFFNFDQADEQADAKALAAARAANLAQLLDADGDGKLTFAEAGGRLRAAFAKIDQTTPGADAAALAKQRTAELLKSADQDADGKISRKEAGGTPVQDPFNRVDVKDKTTNKGDEQLTPEEVETYFTKQEAGRDGAITLDELTIYYETTQAGKNGVLTADELRGYYGGYRNSYGDGPRGTPTIDGKLVYVEGGSGDLTCLDLATGKTLWYKNLAKDFGGGRPGWGYSESPLIEGELLIVTPGGGQGTLAALNKYTGELQWRSSNTEGAHYASPQVADIAGVRQVVQFASKNLFGVRLDDGKLLWEYSHANNGTANIATPIIRGEYVYASSGYGTGGGLVKITNENGAFTADEIYFDKTLANHHGGVVLVGEHLYGFGTGLICQNFMTGENAWKARSVGKGSLTYADGLLFLLGETHEMALADASYEEYRETGRFKIENLGRPAWAHPVVAGGKLYIRNMKTLTAYDVREVTMPGPLLIVALLVSSEAVTQRLESPRQAAPTDVRIVVPDKLAAGEKLRVVYLLPVEAGRERRYGDALDTAAEFDAANKFHVVLVAPSFAALPWYADHPTDAALAQESYFLQDVLPFVEANYPVVAERRGRLLCGFSKSGWGAWSLLLRHPDVFERAASWDAPLLMDAPGKYGSGPIFGTAENFAKYQIMKLLDRRPTGLVLLGRGNFADDGPIHEQLDQLRVPHIYRDDLQTKHEWSPAWLEPALELLTR